MAEATRLELARVSRFRRELRSDRCAESLLEKRLVGCRDWSPDNAVQSRKT